MPSRNYFKYKKNRIMDRQNRNFLIQQIRQCETADSELGNDPIICDFLDELDARGKFHCTCRTKYHQIHQAMAYLGIDSEGSGSSDDSTFEGWAEVGIDVLTERANYLQMIFDL